MQAKLSEKSEKKRLWNRWDMNPWFSSNKEEMAHFTNKKFEETWYLILLEFAGILIHTMW